ncbi:hypothetical protein GPK34_03870 [Secundilactobacillus kimchicus]|uniref:hypothetical protein n=1 Tax=Secundilactobacillus kimchicus TaxID=528209 RepID=UPI001C035C99|nr:hypothetical protein [Secundilactobacillus kimchicus]MBT9671168.1 hypothetical protein [Secundilactobacillus kimchicus]
MKAKRTITRALLIIIVGAAVLVIIGAGSPKNAVRTELFLSGHATLAFKCHPEKDTELSQTQHAPVWSIERKYSYLDSSGSYYEQEFKIHHFLFLNFATSIPPSA